MSGFSNLIKAFIPGKTQPPADASCADQVCETPVETAPAVAPETTQLATGDALTVTHQFSAEPNALRLQINRKLLPVGQTRSYASLLDAAASPLAQALFEAGGIDRVTIEAFSVGVEMHEDADWEAIMNRIPHQVHKFLSAGGVAVNQTQVTDMDTPKKFRFGFQQVEQRSPEVQMALVQDLFDKEVNPAVAAHGGHFTLIDVKDNTVYVQLGGGCQGCGMANVTLRQGVEERLKQVLPEMVALVDTTDHASGADPYYQAGKK